MEPLFGSEQIIRIAIIAIPMVIAITLHEAAHGYAARHFGDHTAEAAGRLTLNPIRHVDPVGTVLLPLVLALSGSGLLFGYAKPVPVEARNMRDPKRDMIWVAAAGPGMNVALAFLSALLLAGATLFGAPAWLGSVLVTSVLINIVLALFNLLPIPPLDGSRVIGGLLPDSLARAWHGFDRFGMIFVLLLFIGLPLIGLSIFPWLIGEPAVFLTDRILRLFIPG